MGDCCICNLALHLSSVVDVKKKGIKTLLKAASLRKDVKTESILKCKLEVTLHHTCYKNYSNIKLAQSVSRSSCGSLPVCIPGQLEDEHLHVTFDFASLCLFCGELISIGARKNVSKVTKSCIRQAIFKYLSNRDDDFATTVIARVQNVPDLVVVNARYHTDCGKRLYRPAAVEESKKPIHPLTLKVDSAMEFIFSYLEENRQECQFSLKLLMDKIPGDYKPAWPTVISRLKDKYGQNEIWEYTSKNQDKMILMRSAGLKLYLKEWYDSRLSEENEEAERFMRHAAQILKREIRSKQYDTTSYPPSDRFFESIEGDIPAPLMVFLNELIVTDKKGSLDHWQRVRNNISHQIVSAVRPRSFISPLKLGIGSFVYKMFGSRLLIDVLSALGVSVSYSEIRRYETSAIQQTQPKVNRPSFIQYVFDNADFNVNTPDGYNTFHAMGGIQCIAPLSALEPEDPITRLPLSAVNTLSGRFGKIPFVPYREEKHSGIKTLQVTDVATIFDASKNILPTIGDFTWLYGKWACIPGVPSWKGFMEEATDGRSFEKTKIFYTPFLNEAPSDYSTIHSVLVYAARQSKSYGQQKTVVTFDQPLYWKAADIVAAAHSSSDLKDVVVRLGGFHLLMSYLGGVGFIMSGSGIEDALKVVYAPHSIEKIMSGHAFARAVRAHFLVYVSLAKNIMEQIDFSDKDRDEIDFYINNIDRSIIFSAEENKIVSEIRTKFESKLCELERRGPTSKLWISYFRMITLLKQFIEAERLADWNLQLETIEKMLPIFHASGHYLYAKSARLYIQTMRKLPEIMPPEDFKMFVEKGFFTMKFNDHFWPSFHSDLAIECFLMKYFKSVGGVTRPGRGITDSTTERWTCGRTSLLNICVELEKFCEVFVHSSEQHVDLRPSRIARDNTDAEKLNIWFTEHQPFLESNTLYSISNGIVGGNEINCHDCFEVGSRAMSSITGKYFGTLTFKRSEKVLPLSAVSNSIKINSTTVPIDPLKIFQRMLLSKQSDEDLKTFFTFELAPHPLSLFTEEGMRKGTKSHLYSCFSTTSEIDVRAENRSEVIDGGWLLHNVVWIEKSTIQEICQQYMVYIKDHFSKNVLIVFDGYPEDPDKWGTKGAERLRRSLKQRSSDFVFNENSIPSMGQQKFLTNDSNKRNFIHLLLHHLHKSGISAMAAEEDADLTIVQSALSEAPFNESVFIVGNDIDLLVLLTGLCPENVTNVYFRKPKHGQSPDQIFSASSLKQIQSVKENILFLHAFSGCDTTSATFGMGKIKFIAALEKNVELSDVVAKFRNDHVDPNDIVTAGNRFLVALYGGNPSKDSLNEMRYKCFVRSSKKRTCNLANLPPTEGAAKYHSYRTYFQVQQWLNRIDEKSPSDWGWKKTTLGWMPQTSDEDAAPSSLLKLISCKCAKNCGKACGCVKAGLHCTAICQHCCGETCNNAHKQQLSMEDDSEDEGGRTASTISFQEDSLPGPSCKKPRFHAPEFEIN